jgi:iron complex outermembrane recepter protein
VAPSNAENRGAILPAARTWQADAGLSYVVSSGLRLVAGVFDVNKPYFNLDHNNFDRQLATQRSSGVELSLSGEIAKNLNVNLGAVLGPVRVIGPNLEAEGIGSTAFGQPRSTIVANVDYNLPSWNSLSTDVGAVRFSSVPASVDGRLSIPAFALLSVGARYKFTLFGAPATLRVQAINIINTYVWTVLYSPGFYQLGPRGVLAYLTVDI